VHYSNVVYFSLIALVFPIDAVAQESWPTKGWPTATPQSVGLDARELAGFDADLAAGKYGHMDGMLIIRHGKVAYERAYKHDYESIYGIEARKSGPLNAHDFSGPYNYFNTWWHPYYRRGDLHTLQSVTKSVTSVVIGVARARREFPDLDTLALKYFDESKVAHLDDRKRRITIRHLLTMTSGLDWHEDVPYDLPNNTANLMEATSDWVKYTIDRPMAQEPGTLFNYSSGVTQLLAHIFQAATGKDIEEYAAQHLFAPLGIEQYFWKRSPSGLADCEGGLYLRSQDMAKILYLMHKDGSWDGRAVVTPAWVKASLAPSVAVPGEDSRYGFQWWMYPYTPDKTRWAWAGSGFGDQLPIVIPEYDLIMVFTGWNILSSKPSLSHEEAIERVLRAVKTQH
jgi:CubicO group peptidase (beta-lactamase class C family)